MKKTKKVLFRLAILVTLAFTLSSCGLFGGRGWGCGGPHYYEDRDSPNQYNRNFNDG